MIEKVETLIVGGGQAGLAISAHLKRADHSHFVFERARIAESWRTARWDSLVANGPAWHDRFPPKEFQDIGPDEFAPKDMVAAYFEEFAKEAELPMRCGIEVIAARMSTGGSRFLIDTSEGLFGADNIVAATGPFQVPVIPDMIPQSYGIRQFHSRDYKNPEQVDGNAVLVVGAGSSGVQIASELLASGKAVFLSVGPHDRPPRRYRGKDNVWWLGVLGKWEMRTPVEGREHVTIAVSGANGGHTIDFRHLANSGINLVGMTESFTEGVFSFANDLVQNIRLGDENYLSLLREADAYIERNDLDFPEEKKAHEIGIDTPSMLNPVLELDLVAEGIETVIWATGYRQDLSWLKMDTFDEAGKPLHDRGISKVPGLYFLGLPWLSMRGSAFIWGVWKDASTLARHITQSST